MLIFSFFINIISNKLLILNLVQLADGSGQRNFNFSLWILQVEVGARTLNQANEAKPTYLIVSGTSLVCSKANFIHLNLTLFTVFWVFFPTKKKVASNSIWKWCGMGWLIDQRHCEWKQHIPWKCLVGNSISNIRETISYCH